MHQLTPDYLASSLIGSDQPAMTSKSAPRRTEALSRRQIEGLIADGRSIIIVNQHVLKVDPWLKYHPGGDKAIQHMVGRDATDEVNAYVLSPSPLSISLTRNFTQTSFSRS